jgi:hypothetical protein
VLSVGLIDHVHCTILSEQWKRFVSFADHFYNLDL